MNHKDRCFVITPIGSESDPIRRHIDGIIEAVIEPALSDKYEVVVSHKINEPGTITKQIIKEIYEDKLVIVNLTERNPNVMYELAFRHSLGKPVILIAEHGTGLPADIISERTIFYKNDAKGTLELKERIRKAESEIDFAKTSSPIYDMLKEINQEISILNNEELLGEDDEKDTDKLVYILNRLGKIENMIAKTTVHSYEKEASRKRREIFIYTFAMDESPDETDLGVIINQVQRSTLWKFDAYKKYKLKPMAITISSSTINIMCESFENIRVADVNELGMAFAEEMKTLFNREITFVGVS
ncbi:MAG: hypothetical protein KH050_13330 [Clostridiaceae bacterium]|nr:hypothetical protein [Clostridiaceae bacterium]